MSWNYRVMQYEMKGVDYPLYMITEVYYDKEGRPRSFIEDYHDAVSGAEDIEDLRFAVTKMQDALEKPVLRYVKGNDFLEEVALGEDDDPTSLGEDSDATT